MEARREAHAAAEAKRERQEPEKAAKLEARRRGEIVIAIVVCAELRSHRSRADSTLSKMH